MNRTSSPPRFSSRKSFLPGPRGLLLSGLLAWSSGSGCAVEDPVAYILTPDGGLGPSTNVVDGLSPGDGTLLPGDGGSASAQELPDAGLDAGTPAGL